jgi:hypothetical protein
MVVEKGFCLPFLFFSCSFHMLWLYCSVCRRFIIDSNRNGKGLISILWKGRLWQCWECEMGIGRPNHKIKHNDARGKLTKINKRKRRNNFHATSFLSIGVHCHRRSSATMLLSLTPKKTTATYCSCAATWPMFGGAWDQPLVSKSSRTSRHHHFPLAYPRIFCHLVYVHSWKIWKLHQTPRYSGMLTNRHQRLFPTLLQT